ncbi:MAG: hypothetical protein ABI723_14290 [Bacteroidia bacterium]
MIIRYRFNLLLLPLILLFVPDCFLFGQGTIDIKSTFYDEVKAIRAAKKTSDFNLRGKVKIIKKHFANVKDTSIYQFSPEGWLLHFQSSKNETSNEYRSVTDYTFENNQLTKTRYKTPSQKRTVVKTYGPSGYLEKEVIDYVDYEEKFHQEGNSSYNASFDQVTINYKHKNQSDSWDVPLADKYMFTFDNKHRLVKVKKTSKHNESTYGNSTTIVYDSILNLPVGIFHADDCAGSNSCLILNMSIQYDKRGNVISETLIDNTVRNALWSYSYSLQSKYNDHNDVIEEYKSQNDKTIQFYGLKPKSTPDSKNYEKYKTVYQYDYDAKGNWVKKYTLLNNKKILEAERVIEYYE